jgi:opacity protein-like surface antigen
VNGLFLPWGVAHSLLDVFNTHFSGQRVFQAIKQRFDCFINMRARLVIFLMLFPLLCSGQRTWWGEYAFNAGGGANDIFRLRMLEGSGSLTGDGMWTAGADLRRLFGDHFGFETGLSYSHQYYHTSPDPLLGGAYMDGNFGLISLPLTARVDFLKLFFADAGAIISVQVGEGNFGTDMTGLGATVGVGLQHNFKSDIFIRVRAYASQFALVHFIPEDYPYTLWNTGVTVGVGYRFIRLGHCNCPADNAPRRR